MLLYAYVPPVQIGAFGYPPLQVGVEIQATLVGSPGSAVGTIVWPLETYLADEGRGALLRTGLAEYAFCGRILEVKSRELGQGLIYQEALLDCGVPVIFASHGIPGMGPLDLVNPVNRELSVGRYLSGLMLLYAHVHFAFREPEMIRQELKVRLRSIAVIDLLPISERLGTLSEVESVDPYSAKFPVIVGVELAEV